MVVVDDKRLTKHGFPKGFLFVPTHLELITILSHRIHGLPLHPKVQGIFHELRIGEYHPQNLHDLYEGDKEHRYIYFFSWREFQNKKRQRGAGAAGQDDEDDDNEPEPRPVRVAKGGSWKPSGGAHVLRWPKDKGGFVAGRMVTMVFYDHHHDHEHGNEQVVQVKSQWGMHEFLLSKPTTTKTTRLHDLALYRLYKLKSVGDDTGSDDSGAGSNQPLRANVSAADGRHFPAPSAGQPSSFGIFTAGLNEPLAGPLAPVTATHTHGAGQEATLSTPAAAGTGRTGSRAPLEQDATGTAEPGRHAQFVQPPQIPAGDNGDGIGMLDWDLDLGSTFDESLPAQQGDNN